MVFYNANLILEKSYSDLFTFISNYRSGDIFQNEPFPKGWEKTQYKNSETLDYGSLFFGSMSLCFAWHFDHFSHLTDSSKMIR
jgi:hypothetical protein